MCSTRKLMVANLLATLVFLGSSAGAADVSLSVQQPGAQRPAAGTASVGLPVFLTTPVTAAELGFEEIVFVKRRQYSLDNY